MRKEIDAMEANGTWILVTMPTHEKPIHCKWVYKIKYKSNGTIERFKARLVVCGNRQVEGIDNHETFAPVAKMTTVRTLLDVATAKNWELHQMDVDNAFLHGKLNEEVYMYPPLGFSTTRPNQVCLLQRSLYGLRQAPRCWFSRLSNALISYGFIRSYADYSLFTLRKGHDFVCIMVYVDDLLIAGNNSSLVGAIKKHLAACFPIKDLGRLKYFLGLEVARSPTGIFLCQRKYTLDLLDELGMSGCKPSDFPMEAHHKPPVSTSPLFSQPERYRRVIGKLIYLTLTRPELSYYVHILAQLMQSPRTNHWDAVLRVIRYLKGQPRQGILLCSASDLRLQGYCDSDWAACPISRRSLTGYLVMLGGSPISWKTKKQPTMSRSSAEAEYRSMATVGCELLWLKRLLLSLGISHSRPMEVFCDNQAALYIASNPIFHERTRHIEIDCHFVRDLIQQGTLFTKHIGSSLQLADIFTKSLGSQQFHFLMSKLGVLNLPAST
ncbi:unnamed protein product [Cuscuta europaea]|nr:unnamed protein product [Cuscuta europaea]